MKTIRYGIAMLFIIIACLTSCGKRPKQINELEVRNAVNQSSPNWHIEYISIYADPTFAKDRDTCTQEIIRRIRDNDFPSYEFSFDETGYPNMLIVSVYENGDKEKRTDPIFRFDYVTDFNYENPERQNNIFDDPETFRLEYHND